MLSSIHHLIGLLVRIIVLSFGQVNDAHLTLLYRLDKTITFDAYLTEESTLQIVTLSDRESSISNIRIIEVDKKGHIVEDQEFVCSSLSRDRDGKKRLFHYEPFWLSQDCFTLSVFEHEGTRWNPTCYFFSCKTVKCLKQLRGVSFNSALSTLSPLQRFFSINVKQNKFSLFVAEKDVSSSRFTGNGGVIFVSPGEISPLPDISQMGRGVILNANHQLQPPPSSLNVVQSLSSFQWDDLYRFFFPNQVFVKEEQGQWYIRPILNDSDKWRLHLASPLRFNNQKLHCTLLYRHKKESFRYLALYVEVQKKETTLDINIIQSKPFAMIGGCASAYYFPAMQHFIIGGVHCENAGIYCVPANGCL